MAKNAPSTAYCAVSGNINSLRSLKAKDQTATQKNAQGSQSFIATKQINADSQSTQTSIFKPLIAASLALSLSSIAIAQGANPAPQAPTKPIITLQPAGGAGEEDKSGEFNLK